MAICKVRIIADHATSDDPIFTVEVQIPWGSLDVMAEVTLSGRLLALNGMHIGGEAGKIWGATALRDIAQGVMEELDREGSAERLSLKLLPGSDLDTVAAARALVRRHLPVKAAHAIMTELFDTGEVYVEVPKVESLGQLISELKALGIEARRHGPNTISVRGVREALQLSQAQFALRFGLEEATVQNWEQGKSKPNATAMALIWTIHRHPEAVVDALVMGGLKPEEIPAPTFGQQVRAEPE